MNREEIKAGDTIAITKDRGNGGYYSRKIRIEFAKVLEVGKSKIKTDRGDFRINSGDSWEKWGSYHMANMTVKEAEEWNLRADKHNRTIDLAYKISETKWRDVSLDVLEKIEALLQESQ